MGIPAQAGEIAGAPAPVVPSIAGDLRIYVGNDAFGRAGTEEDFRTQQTMLDARLSQRWLLAIDHSILTLDEHDTGTDATPGRLDQLSATVGYALIQDGENPSVRYNAVSAGAGIRATGKFAGDRIQNGFHRLTGDLVVRLDYVDSHDVDGIFWLRGTRQRTYSPNLSGWLRESRLGYWIEGTTLASTGGQWDSSVGVYALGLREPLSLWLGLRRDWRSGYDRDPVQRLTARVESGLFGVVGIAIGPLIIESVQALESGTQSFGSVSIVAGETATQPVGLGDSSAGLQLAILAPDMELAAQLRWAPKFLNASLETDRRLRLYTEARYGEPELNGSTTTFIRTRQLTLGGELELELDPSLRWVKPYGALGLGWRGEQPRDEEPGGARAPAEIGRPVLTGDLGLRFDFAGNGKSWSLRSQLGLTGWLPFSDATAEIGARRVRLQDPGLAAVVGVTASFDW